MFTFHDDVYAHLSRQDKKTNKKKHSISIISLSFGVRQDIRMDI